MTTAGSKRFDQQTTHPPWSCLGCNGRVKTSGNYTLKWEPFTCCNLPLVAAIVVSKRQPKNEPYVMLRRMGRRRREEEKEGEGEDALGQFVHRQTVAIWLKSCCRGAFAYRRLAVERLVLDTAFVVSLHTWSGLGEITVSFISNIVLWLSSLHNVIVFLTPASLVLSISTCTRCRKDVGVTLHQSKQRYNLLGESINVLMG